MFYLFRNLRSQCSVSIVLVKMFALLISVGWVVSVRVSTERYEDPHTADDFSACSAATASSTKFFSSVHQKEAKRMLGRCRLWLSVSLSCMVFGTWLSVCRHKHKDCFMFVVLRRQSQIYKPYSLFYLTLSYILFSTAVDPQSHVMPNPSPIITRLWNRRSDDHDTEVMSTPTSNPPALRSRVYVPRPNPVVRISLQHQHVTENTFLEVLRTGLLFAFIVFL